MTDRFAGKRAVVTGGASGIGLTVARRLAAEGAAVSIWDRAGPPDQAGDAGQAQDFSFVQLDISDPAAVEQASRRSADTMGGIDILVCSAGITGPNTTVWQYPVEEWRNVFDVNVHGLFYCNRFVVPHMLAGGYGRIVNIASIAGKEGNPNAAHYSASKAGVIALTKSLGKELATSNIAVNCVTPAVIETDILKQLTQTHIDYMLSKIPMGRFGKTTEAAALVAWLCSADCSFTTGAVFDLSGGRATY